MERFAVETDDVDGLRGLAERFHAEVEMDDVGAFVMSGPAYVVRAWEHAEALRAAVALEGAGEVGEDL